MIISYYPGTGGNRYYQYINDNKSFVLGKAYDYAIPDQNNQHRYIYNDTILSDRNLILTHCVNIPLLKKLFPAHDEIVLILSDLDAGLQRQWMLAGNTRNKSCGIATDYDSAYASIEWHYDYYKNYPLDLTGATTIVNTNDNSDFGIMMNEELQFFYDKNFQLALKDYKEKNV
jgi:hypothetical protein